MSEPSPRFWPLFFELYESLPRQGPGNRECAGRALALCRELPAAPAVLDLGCGVGGQTLHLAGLLPDALITAVDHHAPSIERLRATLTARGLTGRIHPRVADMAAAGLPPASFDLVWSEGALYNLGIDRALRLCRGLLRRGGYLAFTDAVWRRDDPPAAIRASFESDYPAMGRIEDLLAAIARAGFTLEGHFTLPDEAWWEEFYTPMEARLEELRAIYRTDPEALTLLTQLAREPELHRACSDCYAYEFCVARWLG
ncbi:MAG: class I SAM-dependent methyltransferase [Acidobacteria bacterium]|nr:class I SAM-dependent methyltransferase [Thermoanaerobaculia bacterium]NLN12080.1 class I SAM-dependent methyltransferase [Acidobacteriota bacterium]OQC35839.1 MAG: Demethylrebeccamycin-D-glucose O-methyltransferase [Acidobacteria bacterium ADurb.Bin051]MBP7814260.1 class I SAM-dependent methyltransferase [Thermoanaerobaculia bacterium]MBP8845244.1 class I SAM-dependent methyltransferase [Thermoanaerobaculia bacterium]